MLNDKHKEIINHINEKHLHGRSSSDATAIAIAVMTAGAMIAESITESFSERREDINGSPDNVVSQLENLTKTVFDIWG